MKNTLKLTLIGAVTVAVTILSIVWIAGAGGSTAVAAQVPPQKSVVMFWVVAEEGTPGLKISRSESSAGAPTFCVWLKRSTSSG